MTTATTNSDGDCCAVSSGVAPQAASSSPLPYGHPTREPRGGTSAGGWGDPPEATGSLCGRADGDQVAQVYSPSSSPVARRLHPCRAEGDPALGAMCLWRSHWLCGLAQEQL